MQTRIGRLSFADGAPSADAVETLRDHLDFLRAVEVFMSAHPGAFTVALRRGFPEAGARDGDVIIFSELMDSESLFLTANADTVYDVGTIDLSGGPVVIETPPDALGVFDDMWFRHVIDFGRPGPDRGERGRFLLVPQVSDGSLPDGGFHVAHVRTSRALLLGRSFLTRDDPASPTCQRHC